MRVADSWTQFTRLRLARLFKRLGVTTVTREESFLGYCQKGVVQQNGECNE